MPGVKEPVMAADPVIVVVPTKLGESILISDFADNCIPRMGRINAGNVSYKKP